MGEPLNQPLNEAINQERAELLEQYEDWTEFPGLLLGIIWMVLLVIDLLNRLNPFFDGVFNLIWIIFVIDFAIRFILSPRKFDYLKRNWLTALSLALPVLRIARLARVLRVARAARGMRLFRVVSSLNRGMRSLRRSFGRRGFGYVTALTVIVTLVGAAGMYTFESPSPAQVGALNSYGEAVWWTAMTMTTMGSGDYSPVTAEGRVLAFLLALYAFAVFGYVTAALASFFIGRDVESQDAEISCLGDIHTLREEIQALRAELNRAK